MKITSTIHQQLLGKLAPTKGLGARGLSQLAQNPSCERRIVLSVLKIPVSYALEQIFNIPAKEGISLFAHQKGVLFENALFEKDACRLLNRYIQESRLSPKECKVADLEKEFPGTSTKARLKRRQKTEEYLLAKLQGKPDTPNILVKPLMVVTIAGIEHEIEPDFLVASNKEDFYTAGEIKSYEDRGSKTEVEKINSACYQAAVTVIALSQFASRVGYQTVTIPHRCDLILSRSDGWKETLRPMTLAKEVQALETIIAQAPKIMAQLPSRLGSHSCLDNKAALSQVPNNYNEQCQKNCSLYKACRKAAHKQGSTHLLGTEAVEAFGDVINLNIVLDLLHKRRVPRSPKERILLQELTPTFQQLTQVASYA